MMCDGVVQSHIHLHQILNFLDQVDQLLIKVNHNLILLSLNDPEHFDSVQIKVSQISSHLPIPIRGDSLSVQSPSQSLSLCLALPSFRVLGPVLGENFAHLISVLLKPVADLFGPHH